MSLDLQWQRLYTADQIAKMAEDSALAKVAVYVAVGGGDDIMVCTGKDPITYDSKTFESVDISVGRRRQGGPASIVFPNAEQTYSRLKYDLHALIDKASHEKVSHA